MPPSSLSSLTWSEARDWFLDVPVKVLVVVLLAVVVRWLLHRTIDRVVAGATSRAAQRLAQLPGLAGWAVGATGIADERHVQRMRTMGTVLRSVTTIIVSSIALVTVLALLGIPLAPLIASAGVGGVALGFGAQSLVKDFLSGIFMIVEDQYGVGDVVDTGEITGTVEDVSLRVTRLRDANGVTWYVRNGEILRVGNTSQGWSVATVDMPIAYDEDVEKAKGVIAEACAAMAEEQIWKDKLLEVPHVTGVESIGATSVTIRVVARCLSGANFSVQRELRERIKHDFDVKGVRGPIPPGYPTPAVPPHSR